MEGCSPYPSCKNLDGIGHSQGCKVLLKYFVTGIVLLLLKFAWNFGQNTEICLDFSVFNTEICVKVCKNTEIIAICYCSEFPEVGSPAKCRSSGADVTVTTSYLWPVWEVVLWERFHYILIMFCRCEMQEIQDELDHTKVQAHYMLLQQGTEISDAIVAADDLHSTLQTLSIELAAKVETWTTSAGLVGDWACFAWNWFSARLQ